MIYILLLLSDQIILQNLGFRYDLHPPIIIIRSKYFSKSRVPLWSTSTYYKIEELFKIQGSTDVDIHLLS